MENPATPLLSERQNSGYNNCFVLGGKAEKKQKDGTKKLVKIRAYIDGCGKVQWLGKDHLNY